MSKKSVGFNVSHWGDDGVHPFSEVVTVTLDSGDAGGATGEFEDYMRSCLADWYDGAQVTLRTDAVADNARL